MAMNATMREPHDRLLAQLGGATEPLSKGETQSLSPLPMNNTTQTVQIRVHGVDGSIRTFPQEGGSLIRQTLNWFQPTYIFTQKRIEIPGERSFTTFMVSQVTRIDLVTEPRSNWSLPPNVVEAVELSEPAFRTLARAPQPPERQKASLAPDDTAMVLIDIALSGGQHLFLAQEMAFSQPAQDMHMFGTLLTTTGFTFLMRTGGVAVLNVANVVCFTVYPDPAQLSADVSTAARQRCGTELRSPQRESGLPGIGEQEAA